MAEKIVEGIHGDKKNKASAFYYPRLIFVFKKNSFTSYFPSKTNQEQAKGEQKIMPQKSASPTPTPKKTMVSPDSQTVWVTCSHAFSLGAWP